MYKFVKMTAIILTPFADNMDFCDLQIFKEKYMPMSNSLMGLGAQWAKLVGLVGQEDMEWKGMWPISGGCVYKEMPLAQ